MFLTPTGKKRQNHILDDYFISRFYLLSLGFDFICQTNLIDDSFISRLYLLSLDFDFICRTSLIDDFFIYRLYSLRGFLLRFSRISTLLVEGYRTDVCEFRLTGK